MCSISLLSHELYYLSHFSSSHILSPECDITFIVCDLAFLTLRLKVTTVPLARPAYSVFQLLWRQRTRSDRVN